MSLNMTNYGMSAVRLLHVNRTFSQASRYAGHKSSRIKRGAASSSGGTPAVSGVVSAPATCAHWYTRWTTGWTSTASCGAWRSPRYTLCRRSLASDNCHTQSHTLQYAPLRYRNSEFVLMDDAYIDARKPENDLVTISIEKYVLIQDDRRKNAHRFSTISMVSFNNSFLLFSRRLSALTPFCENI